MATLISIASILTILKKQEHEENWNLIMCYDVDAGFLHGWRAVRAW